ncbi:MAG: CsbD family protein, partial [Candidatus Nanopelagicales bacterium]|nr:CsbD family protein [Candidatus Nanopelagicales bacterium]
ETIDWNSRLANEGRWQQARGRIRQTWGAITDDELDSARGNWDRLVGAIKEKTGEAADTVEDKLRGFFR